ncbi:hypothetical protein [Streptomyces sp. TLI_185]|uniref:hypothetical protein n=1 Tax=Streptomyces sp. TLI_185 TaxID=2485151 RepID=UPI000F4D7E12|nr:hypothetical protein [Streptomyces sp. TLI_185]RPF38096.1 hypothetical protein EDD92_8210 [Streptomyces sp. TLI_185]
MSTEPDARLLNWRFVVPGEPAGLLLLPATTERLPGAVSPGRAALAVALRNRRYPAVATPDLAAWVLRHRPRAAHRMLTDMATAVAPGGWLCVGFPNRWYPAAPLRPGSLSLTAALRATRRAGLTGAAVYAALPDQRRAAFLVPMARPAEMDHTLSVLFDTSFPSGGRGAVAFRRILTVLRRVALAAPRARRRLMPAYYVVARRPT